MEKGKEIAKSEFAHLQREIGNHWRRSTFRAIAKSEAKLSVGPEVRGLGDTELLITHQLLLV